MNHSPHGASLTRHLPAALLTTLVFVGYAMVATGASDLEITSFKINGALTWKCSLPNAESFRIEWAPAPNGPWLSLGRIEATNAICTAQVPLFHGPQASMFFRVAAITTPLTNSPTQRVWGSVCYASTSIPIAGVHVSINGSTYTTGASGDYELLNIPLGFALLEARKDKYDAYRRTIQVDEITGLNGYDIEMTSGDLAHDLSGNVNDALGKPVGDVVITVLNPDGTSSRLIDTTSAAGHYQIPGVPQGTRTVSFAKPGFDTKEVQILIYDREKVFDLMLRRSPEAQVSSPLDNSTWFTSDTILLVATVKDDAGNSVSGNSLRWSSDLDGMLGTGNRVTCQALSQGTHIITLQAMADGCSVPGLVHITIFVNAAPKASDIVGDWAVTIVSGRRGTEIIRIVLNEDFSISSRTPPPRNATSKMAGSWSLQGNQLNVSINPIRRLQGRVTSYSCAGSITMGQPLTMSGSVSGYSEWQTCFNGRCSTIAGQPTPESYSFSGTSTATRN